MAMATANTVLSSVFTTGRLVARTPAVHSPRLARPLSVRADAQKDAKKAAEGIFEGTKNPITASDVEKNMAQNESEKQSVFGAVPSSGPLPRPEIERRPETGERSFGSIMAFDGPGPETINGRLAMTGFVWALISEAITHKTIWQQISEPGNSGLFWLIVAVNVIISASVIPMFNGESPDSRSNGPFTAQAERWNGRVAMIGYFGLLVYELAAGKSLL